MFSPEIILLGLALAIDAAVVTFTIGLLHLDLHLKTRISRAFFVAGVFGLFQFLMMWLGSYGGYLFSFSNYGYLFQLVVASIFILIGAKCFQESFKNEDKVPEWGIWPVMMLGLATSIDALAAGISFGTLPKAYLASMEVGIITFTVCLGFYLLSQIFTKIPERWLLRLAGIIFFVLGGQIIWGIYLKGAA